MRVSNIQGSLLAGSSLQRRHPIDQTPGRSCSWPGTGQELVLGRLWAQRVREQVEGKQRWILQECAGRQECRGIANNVTPTGRDGA